MKQKRDAGDGAWLIGTRPKSAARDRSVLAALTRPVPNSGAGLTREEGKKKRVGHYGGTTPTAGLGNPSGGGTGN